jgi:hypothetical protein
MINPNHKHCRNHDENIVKYVQVTLSYYLSSGPHRGNNNALILVFSTHMNLRIQSTLKKGSFTMTTGTKSIYMCKKLKEIAMNGQENTTPSVYGASLSSCCMALTTAALKRGCNTRSGNFCSGKSTMPARKKEMQYFSTL